MSGIVCAVRGGPASQPTIQKSIELAQETGQDIYFLYVVNLDFLAHTASGRYHLIEQEMVRMGEFILLVAQDKAESQGVHASGITRDGNVQDEIVALCIELQADYVVLGSPRQTSNNDILGEGRLDRFRQRIEQESKAQVVLAAGGSA